MRLVVAVLLLTLVGSVASKQFVAETCCVNCQYKNSAGCCCPKRNRVLTVIRTATKVATRTACIGATTPVPSKARSNDDVAPPSLFRRHICPVCAPGVSGPCCPVKRITRSIWRTRTSTRLVKCPKPTTKRGPSTSTVPAAWTTTKTQTQTKTAILLPIETKTATRTRTAIIMPIKTQTQTKTAIVIPIETKTPTATRSPTQTQTQTATTQTQTATTQTQTETATRTETRTTTTAPVIIYDSIPDVLPGNVASQGFQCCQTSEFGDQVQFANVPRNLVSAEVTLSVWSFKSGYPSFGDASGWDQLLTLNIYAVGANDGNGNPTLGALLGTVNATFHVPWRPEPDPVNCPTKSSPGYAYKFQKVPGAADTNCFNGLATTVTFDLTSLALTVPDQIVWGVAFNTQTYGSSPTGVEGPYNSLNIGAEGTGASVGTDVSPAVAWIKTNFAGFYCDNGAGGTGTFRPDVGCSSGNDWTGYTPQIKFVAL